MLKKATAIGAVLVVLIVVVLAYPMVPDTDAAPGSTASALDPALTRELTDFADVKDTIDALVIADSNQFLLEHGITHTPINTHSVRKSIMSVVAGMSVRTDDLDIRSTLVDLGINDATMPLTDVEKSATVADLLKARSGIYIEAGGETAEMKAGRPQRGQFAPGEHYYYNNWDFNTLASVLQSATGKPLSTHMDRLAKQLEFQDYASANLYFDSTSGSEHDQYIIFLSARDLARVGQLMLRQGLAPGGQPLITPEWIRESTTSHSELSDYGSFDGYGYLWWIDEDTGTYWATGWGGQFMLVDPTNDLVVVTRNHTGRHLGTIIWLAVLGNSTQGQTTDVALIHQMLIGS